MRGTLGGSGCFAWLDGVADCSCLLADDSEAARVIASLREKLKAQSTEIESLHSKLSSAAKEHEAEVSAKGD